MGWGASKHPNIKYSFAHKIKGLIVFSSILLAGYPHFFKWGRNASFPPFQLKYGTIILVILILTKKGG